MANRGLLDRLKDGGSVIIAEGYMWEFERRGYLKSGSHIPEVVLEHPELVKIMTEEFVHAGSDVCEAFTYYAHREKLRLIGREGDLEKMNRTALRIARQIATSTGTLCAGGLSNTGIYQPDDEKTHEEVAAMFKEQVEWAAEEGADYMIGETFNDYGEAKLALDAIKKYGKGIPAVITLVPLFPDETTDGYSFPDACRKLEESGAAVVGLNCGRGPQTMIPLLREIRKVCKGPLAALPVAFRTTDTMRTLESLKDPDTGKYLYPTNVSCLTCSRDDLKQFAVQAKEIGVNYLGVCCGNAAIFTREVAEVYGRKPEGSKYSPDISLNYIFGETDKTAKYDVSRLKAFMLYGKPEDMKKANE